MTDRPSVRSTAPLFVVSDLQTSIDFFQKLGFGEPGVWGEPPCFAMLNRDGFDIMLSLAEEPQHVRPNGPNGIWDLYIKVTDLRPEKDALEQAGVPLRRQPEPTVYGMMEMEVVDPDGYRICFGQDGQW